MYFNLLDMEERLTDAYLSKMGGSHTLTYLVLTQMPNHKHTS